MKRLLTVFALLTMAVSSLPALPDYLKRSDDLSLAGQSRESFNLLVGMLPMARTDQERAEIYWRLSRDTLMDADDRRASESADPMYSVYKEGESSADRAIAFDPLNAAGYYLKACNIGRRLQAQGRHASLSEAESMRQLLVKAIQIDPRFSGAWYVLGQLYEQVPGWPLSFGDVVWAVSLGRKSIDASMTALSESREHDISLDYSIQLARHLAKRNWSLVKRTQEQENEARMFNATDDAIEKGFYYEGIVRIPPVSDRVEARQLCQFVISRLQSVYLRTPSQNVDLANAQETLRALGE